MVAVLVHSFRNFAGDDFWRGLKRYKFAAKKAAVDSELHGLVLQNTTKMRFADAGSLPEYELLAIQIGSGYDTVNFIYRFAGNDSIWAVDEDCTLTLFQIEDKDIRMNYKNRKDIDREKARPRIDLFEQMVIKSLRRRFPE